MAITAEQAAAISTAIENLNRSVQVNEEVLQIIKSMQTTGAAGDVAQHATDIHAHAELDEFLIPTKVYIGQKVAFKDNGSTIKSEVLKTGNNSSAYTAFYAVAGEIDSQASYPAVLSNVKYSTSNTRQLTQLFAIRATLIDENEKNERSAEIYLQKRKDTGSTILFNVTQDKVLKSYRMDSSTLTPFDGADLGSSTFQWKDLYLKNSPTVSSDRRLKQDFASVPEAVFKAWEKVNFCQYKFKEAVEKKGAEARFHVGLVAQEILEAFEAQGLDATKYGIVCHDSWEDQYQDVEVGTKPAVLNEKGEVVKTEEPIMEHQLVKPAGDLWTVRYEEALALEAAYQRWKLQKIEAALKAKGIEL